LFLKLRFRLSQLGKSETHPFCSFFVNFGHRK
jgi:hypothetical protein